MCGEEREWKKQKEERRLQPGDNKPTNLHLHAATTHFHVNQAYLQTMKKHATIVVGDGHMKMEANHEIACQKMRK